MQRFEQQSEFKDRLVAVNRVSKTVKGGRNARFSALVVVGNEEAKLRGMAGNRHIGNIIMAGPFFVCGEAYEDFCSLTDEEAASAMIRFAEPEEISQAEVEADMGFTIYYAEPMGGLS